MACPINVPPYPPIPDGATLEQREKMYKNWCRELSRTNPSYFFTDGRRRGVMSWIASLFCGRRREETCLIDREDFNQSHQQRFTN